MATKHRTAHRKEVHGSSKDALVKMLSEKREALKNFRFGISGSRVKDLKGAREIRKDIARILTKLNEKKA